MRLRTMWMKFRRRVNFAAVLIRPRVRQLRKRPPSRRVWGALRSARIGVSGQPECIQTNEGGAWQNEVWADPCSERRVKFQIQGAGARSWILERRKR